VDKIAGYFRAVRGFYTIPDADRLRRPNLSVGPTILPMSVRTPLIALAVAGSHG
jgi:hypothetical protein